MRAKQLIEKLEDLATFLTLAANDANKEGIKAQKETRIADAHVWEGMAAAYNISFNKVDGIIKQAKK